MGMMRRILGSEPDRVAALVRKELQRRGAVETWYDAGRQMVLYRSADHAADDPAWMTLGRLVRLVREAGPEHRAAVVSNYLDTMLSVEPLPRAWHEAAPAIRLVLRDRTFVHEQYRRGPAVDVLHRPVLESLIQVVAMDSPPVIRYLRPEVLDLWRVTEDELFDTGLRNLEALALAEGPPGVSSHPSSVTYSDPGDRFYSSRLLLPGWVAAHVARVAGPPVVFVPDQDTLIVTTAASRGLADLHVDMLLRYLRAEHPLSPLGYGLDAAGRVGLVRLGPETVLGRRTMLAERVLAFGQYAGQGRILRERIAAGGQDIEVCGVRLPKGWDEVACRTWTEWQPRDCLLPVVDDVVLIADGIRFAVPWEVLAEELPLVPEPDLDPPRIRMTGWPDRAVLDRLWGRRLPEAPGSGLRA